MTPILIAPRGGPVDACWHEGRIVVAYQDGPGPDALLVQRSYTPQGSVLSSVTYPLGSDVGAFPRLLSAHGSVWLIYREGASFGGRAVLRRDGVEVWRSPVECGGNDPVCLGGQSFAWQEAHGPTHVYFLSDLVNPVGEMASRPTGLSHFPGVGIFPILVDDARGAVEGMTRPSWAGDLVAGEHPDSGVLVREVSA